MTVIKGIIALCQVFMFFANLWKERDSKKAEEKKELGKELIDAVGETDRDKQASKYNNVIQHIRRVRKQK